MELEPYIATLRQEFASAAEAAGDEAMAVAERLVVPLESSVRLALLEALSAAADEITCDLAPGSVHVRLQGREPQFVVTPAPQRRSPGRDRRRCRQAPHCPPRPRETTARWRGSTSASPSI